MATVLMLSSTGPASAATGTAGAGGSLNLELVPPALQQCFGTSGFINWSGEGTIHVNGTGQNRAHYSGDLTVRAWLGTWDAPTLSGTTTVSWDAFVPVDPVHGADIVTPAHIDLLSADGTAVIHATFNFHEIVVPLDGSSTQYDYSWGLLGLPSFSDFSCT